MADPVKSFGEADRMSQASKKKDDFGSTLNAASEKASRTADQVSAAAAELAEQSKQGVRSAVQGAQSSASTLKDQAVQAANEAKITLASMTDDARKLFTDLIDQQKTAGADTVAGLARAAQAAASDLDRTSPQTARLIRTAAEGVDQIAENIRSNDVGDLVAGVSDFGRRQPVALLGSAVLAGFLLARFIKSDAPGTGSSASSANPRRV